MISEIDISIIIISKNKGKYIDSVLNMLFLQKIDRIYEIIAIDSGSRDSTLDIVKRYPVELVEITPEEFGHGKTRNKGAQIARGKIIVFLNADSVPIGEDWLKNLVYNFENDEKIIGVYSRVYPRLDCNPLRSWEIFNDSSYHYKKKIKYIEDFDNYIRMTPRDKRILLSFHTISCAIRKDILLKYPFLDIEFGEDLEWSKRMMEMGFKIVFESESKVLHSHDFYCSFIKTFKRYFDDAKLNNYLLNIWSWRNLPILAASIMYKVFKDVKYILQLNRNAIYKMRWLFYSPVIRSAEFYGIILGINSKYISPQLQTLFSLVSEIKNENSTNRP